MKKLFLCVVAAAAMVVGVAGPAAATTVTYGKMQNSSCPVGESWCWVIVDVPNQWANVSAKVDENGYVWNCARYGVPEGSYVSSTMMYRIKQNGNPNITVVWDRPAGYRDSVTCD